MTWRKLASKPDELDRRADDGYFCIFAGIRKVGTTGDEHVSQNGEVVR